MIYPEEVKEMAKNIMKDVRAKNQWNGKALKAIVYHRIPEKYHGGARKAVEKIIPDKCIFVSTDKGYKTLKKCLRGILNEVYKTNPEVFAAPPRANDDEEYPDDILGQTSDSSTQKTSEVTPNGPIS